MSFAKRFVLRGLVGLAALGAATSAPQLWAQNEGAPAASEVPTEKLTPAAAEPAKEGASSAQDAIRKALQTVAKIDATDLPLVDLVSLFKSQHNIEIQIDTKALEEAGVAPDAPLTFSSQQLTLGAVLRHVLRQHDLTWAVDDGLLVITTPEEAEQSQLKTRVFQVADLIAPSDRRPDASINGEVLMTLLQSVVAPDAWDEVGGPGSMTLREGTLAVCQTEEVHEQIAGLLATLQEAHGKLSAHVLVPPAANENARRVRQAIDEALAHPIKIEVTDLPLTDVVSLLKSEHPIPILIDAKALEEAGITPDTPVTASIQGVSVAAGLEHIFRQLGLTWMVQDEALVITTPEEAEQVGLRVQIYPIADLLRTANESSETQSSKELIATVFDIVANDSWDEVGGPGSLEYEPGSQSLVCSQTEQVQAKVAELLAELRRARAAQPEAAKWADDDDIRMELKVYALPATWRSRDQAADPAPTLDAESVALLVGELVAPDSWKNEQATIRSLGDRLVVRQTRRVQREIFNFLKQLGEPHADKGNQVMVGGYF